MRIFYEPQKANNVVSVCLHFTRPCNVRIKAFQLEAPRVCTVGQDENYHVCEIASLSLPTKAIFTCEGRIVLRVPNGTELGRSNKS